ncbi:hypothetical protein [Glycocaulis sp.]|uniref:hypothetical protein n=1 Tax=Glycocaulis sp. TaxID=1969725 RepID=UPI003F72518B
MSRPEYDASVRRPGRCAARAAISAAILAFAVVLPGAAMAQQPSFNPPPPRAPDIRPGEACSLVLVQGRGTRQLIARAAPGISGHWSLSVRSDGLQSDQSGPLQGGSSVQELTRITLDGQYRPVADHSAAGLYGPVTRPGAAPVQAALVVRDGRGRVVCRAAPELR